MKINLFASKERLVVKCPKIKDLRSCSRIRDVAMWDKLT